MSKIYKNGESVKVCTNCGDWSEEDNEWDTYETVVFNKDNYTKKKCMTEIEVIST